MSIFNKDALSSFLAYLAKKMIIMITTKNMKSAKQLMNHRVVRLGLNHNALFNNRKVTVSQHTQQSEPVVEKPSARYRSAETHQERDTQQNAYREKSGFYA